MNKTESLNFLPWLIQKKKKTGSNYMPRRFANDNININKKSPNLLIKLGWLQK